MGYKESHFVYAANISISSGVPVNGKLASSSSENTYQFTITKDGEGHIPHANGKKLGETTATNGEYLIKIPKQKAGTVITVYTVDAAGNRSADKTVKVLDRTPPTTPTVSSVSDWSTVISGTAESNARVYAYAKSKKLGEATAKSGKYSLKLSKQKAGTVITVYAVDPSGNKSGSRTVKVFDKTPPATPSVNKVTSKSTTITGSAEKSATVYVYNKSKKLGSGKVDSEGHFKVKIKAQKKKSTLTVYVKDAAGNSSKAKSVTVY